MASHPVRLSDRRRFLILKSIRYAMDSRSLWTWEPGPPVFELYMIARAMVENKRGRPWPLEGGFKNSEMMDQIDGWIKELETRPQEVSPAPSP